MIVQQSNCHFSPFNRKRNGSQFKSKNIIPQTSTVAGDAIAFVVSKDFADSTISISELIELLKEMIALY
jgi:hypothetical protein